MKPVAVLRQPLLHFLLLGAALFGMMRWTSTPPAAPQTIRVTQGDLQRLRYAWMADTRREPTPDELQASLRRYIDETILLREALRLRLDETDAVTRNRLLMNMHFAFADSQADDAQLLREARDMGMREHDLVVRRRLIELMEQRIASNLQLTEAETQQYVAQHPERYAVPARYGYSQIYFSRDVRHAAAKLDAQRCLTQLKKNPATNCAADVFLLGTQFTSQTVNEIVNSLGPSIAQQIIHIQPLHWTGPVESIYGWHLLRVDHIEPAQDSDYASVRRRASYALLAERENQSVTMALNQLRQRYVVQMP
jgi:hypothetical protein